MDRRAFMGSLGAYGAVLAGARAQGTSRAPKLKIREIRAVPIKGIKTHYVRIYTDQGLTGTGETLDTVGAADIINKFMGPGLVGRDPLEIEKIYYDLFSYPNVFLRGNGGGPYMAAISGIEMALWDVAGKALGLPIYQLMGGKIRDQVPVYFHNNDEKKVGDFIKSTGVHGIKTQIDYTTAKDNASAGWDPPKICNWTLTNKQIDNLVAHVAAMRETMGPETALMLECHTRYDTESALQICKAMEPYRPAWVEEPIPPDNVDAMAFIRSHARVPIASGENVYTRYGYRTYLEKQAVSIIQLDMAKCGGLWESRKIMGMAEIYHIPAAPHGVASRLGIAAYSHVCATVPNLMCLEWAFYPNPMINSLTKEGAVDYRDGFIHVSDTPGIGVELNEDAVKEHQLAGYANL